METRARWVWRSRARARAADPSLRRHDPDQVQRDRLAAVSAPVMGRPSDARETAPEPGRAVKADGDRRVARPRAARLGSGVPSPAAEPPSPSRPRASPSMRHASPSPSCSPWRAPPCRPAARPARRRRRAPPTWTNTCPSGPATTPSTPAPWPGSTRRASTITAARCRPTPSTATSSPSCAAGPSAPTRPCPAPSATTARTASARCRVSAVMRWSRADRAGRGESGTNTVRLDLAREGGALKIVRESGEPVSRRGRLSRAELQ